ncbi:MAG: rod shape-determining protein MreC, partial [Pseudomonadota bacterium]
LRNGLRTIAVGTGQLDRLELPYLLPTSDVRVGDLLVTSGMGGHFPANYPVAEVTEVNDGETGLFGQVVAKPLASLGRAREVMLVWSIDAENLGVELDNAALPEEAALRGETAIDSIGSPEEESAP